MEKSEEHLQSLRLFDLAWNGGSKITDEERKHLRECDECKVILELFARQFARRFDPGEAG